MHVARSALPSSLVLCVVACSGAGLATIPEHDAAPPSSSGPDDAGGVDAASRGDAARKDASHADDARPSDGSDPLAASFVFVGCNRLKKSDWSSSVDASSANVAQLQQTFADVAALADTPRFFFFTGDLVLGLKKGTLDLTTELSAWASLFASDPNAAKVPLVPLPGNHEMLYKDSSSGDELSNAAADGVWTSWLGAHGFDAHAGNGPTSAAPNADALADDQSKLSYSFDEAGVHFVTLNTDTLTTTPDSSTGSTQIGWVALHWLADDLAAAQANANVTSIFVFGHKPLVAPSATPASDDTLAASLVAPMEALLDATPKVKGYFCAHAHQWDARRLPGSRGVYQVIAGNGGSPLSSDWNVADPWYGFTEARVYASGRVGVVDHQRPVPTPYYASPAAPATAASELVIAP